MRQQAYGCPRCGSDRIKRLSLVHEEGFSQLQSGTVLAAVAGGRLGTGVAATQGVQQTELSRRAAPPERPRREPLGPLIIVAGIIGAIVLLDQHAAAAGVVLVFALWLGITWSWKVNAANRRDYAVAQSRWERGYLCERCGEMFALT